MNELGIQELVGACYSRVSTEQLASTDHGSLEQQRHLCDEWAAYLSKKTGVHHKIKFYLEDAAMSGATEDRPGYQQLKVLIKERKIRFIIFKELSRATRDLRELLNFIALAQANSVDIHVRGMDNINLSSPTGTVMVHLMGSLGQYERSLCIQRVKENIRSSARNNGKINGGPIVLGFDRNPDKKGFWIPNESELRHVNFIMKTFLETGSLKITSDECKRFGIKNKTGVAFTPKSVRSILTNYKYIGKIKVFEGLNEDKFEWVNVLHGCVVDEDLFNRVQKKLSSEERNSKFTQHIKKKVYLLTGVLFYFEDGSSFTGQSCTNGSGSRLEYYWNTKHKVRLWAVEFENAVFDALVGCLSKSEELASLITSLKGFKDSKTQMLNEQIKSLKRDLKNLSFLRHR